MTAGIFVESVSTPRTSLATGISVTVPTIADAEMDEVAVDVSSSGFGFTLGLGDLVIVNPEVALPTSCVFQGAYVSAADEITFSFGTLEGGAGVTGAAKTFAVLAFDATP